MSKNEIESLASDRKVFCLGFNKTGTSSLHYLFQRLGLTSCHNDQWPLYSMVQDLERKKFAYQCYCDGEGSNFIKLDQTFPGSLFILNDRNERDWLHSRVRHVLRHNEVVTVGNILLDSRYGKMARDFFFDEELAIRKWICERRLYIMQVKEYFRNRLDFIEIDIPGVSDWVAVLLNFFDDNLFPHGTIDLSENIHRNQRDDCYIEDQNLLVRYKQLVDSILREAKA